MTRPDRDPDRRRPAPPHPGFAQKPLDIDLDVCRLCRAIVPATELARLRHLEWDARIEQLAVLTPLTEEPRLTSGSVKGPPPTPTDPDPNRPQGPTASEVPHG